MRAQRRMENNNTKVSIPLNSGPVKNIAEDSDMSDEEMEAGGDNYKQLRNYNAHVRKQFNNQSLQNATDEHSSDEDDEDIDNKSDDDEFIDGLQKKQESKKTGDGVDLDKLTKRQRMAYLSKQNNNLNLRGQFSANLQQLDQNGVMQDQSHLSGSVLGDLDDFSEGLPLKSNARRAPKNQISQAQADENKRR